MVIQGENCINSSENNTLKTNDDKYNFWIHRIDLDDFSEFDDKKCIGSVNENSRNIKKVNKDDLLFLLTKRNGSLEFFGYAKVEDTFVDDEFLYNDYYKSKNKLKLKIKYLKNPISTLKISNDLDFVKNKKNSSSFFKSEYRKITIDDFKVIRSKANLINILPAYLDEFSMNFNEFLEKTIRLVYDIVKHYESRNQIEILKFLDIVEKFVKGYGFKKDKKYLIQYYSKNAVSFGFKHVPSRDPDKFVPLYTYSGDEKNFAYISLE